MQAVCVHDLYSYLKFLIDNMKWNVEGGPLSLFVRGDGRNIGKKIKQTLIAVSVLNFAGQTCLSPSNVHPLCVVEGMG